jgi:hypothetical protein
MLPHYFEATVAHPWGEIELPGIISATTPLRFKYVATSNLEQTT